MLKYLYGFLPTDLLTLLVYFWWLSLFSYTGLTVRKSFILYWNWHVPSRWITQKTNSLYLILFRSMKTALTFPLRYPCSIWPPHFFFFMTLPTHLNKWFMIVAVSHKMNTQKFLLSVYYVQGSVVTKRFLASGCISCMEKRHWITTGKNQEEGLWFYPVSLSQTFLVKSLFLH